MNKFFSEIGLIAVALTLVFSSCKPEKKETITTENYKGIFVVNEGGFLKSNGSIGLYKPGTGDYFDAFLKANGRPLGDVVQSMTLIDGKYYIVVNNSNKIEVVNQEDFKSVATLSVNQPRSILKVSDTKAYISQLNSSVISVLDLATNTITKTIQVKTATDNMALMNKVVYVGEAYGARVFMVNTVSDIVSDSLMVGGGVSSIVNTGGKIGVFCIGSIDYLTGNILENGKIAIINQDSNKVERVITMATAGYGGSMMENAGSLYYHFGDGKLFTIANTATAGTTTPLITISGSIYGFNINPSNADIYITDAGNFDANGKLHIYNSAGTLQRTIATGIAPSRVVFND